MHLIKTSSLIAASCLILAASAQAQPEPGDIGIFFDSAGTESRTFVEPFVPFDAYLVAFGPIKPFWFVAFGLQVPPGVGLVGWETLPGWDVNMGPAPFGLVSGEYCLDGSNPLWIMRLDLMLVSDQQDLPICIGPYIASPFPTAEYGPCDASDDPIPFTIAQNGLGVYSDGCGIVNPTHGQAPIGNESESWGSVKALYAAD